MKLEHVQVKEVGTPLKKRPFTTAGLASGYQRTNVTTSGVLVAETTGGFMIPDLITLPSYISIPLTDSILVFQPDLEIIQEKMKEGYKSMFRENYLDAEDDLSIALEVWPAWEE